MEAVAEQLGTQAAQELSEALEPARRPPAPTYGGPRVARNATPSRIRQSLMEEALLQIVRKTPAGTALLRDVREEIGRLDRLDSARALR